MTCPNCEKYRELLRRIHNSAAHYREQGRSDGASFWRDGLDAVISFCRVAAFGSAPAKDCACHPFMHSDFCRLKSAPAKVRVLSCPKCGKFCDPPCLWHDPPAKADEPKPCHHTRVLGATGPCPECVDEPLPVREEPKPCRGCGQTPCIETKHEDPDYGP